jgi:hypothetical protein
LLCGPVGVSAAFLPGVRADLGLFAAALVGVVLVATAGQGHRTAKA